MQKCKKCSNKFKWKNIIKSIWIKGYAPIECDICNTNHEVNFSTRLILSISMFIPIPLFINNYIYRIFEGFIIIPFIIWIIVMICITPFYARYHIKPIDDNDDTKSLLVSNLNSIESDIIISILESYDIPFLKKSTGSGGIMEIYAGSNYYGIDIYVQPHMLQKAKELINPQNIDYSQSDID